MNRTDRPTTARLTQPQVEAQARALLTKAIALRQRGRDDEAASHFDRAAALRPNDATYTLPARMHRGTVLEAQGRDDDAMAHFEAAVVDFPDQADAWAALGVLQWRLQGAVVATASFQRALQLDPTRPEIIEKFGQTLLDHHRYEDAAFAFERLLKLDPKRPLTPGRLMHCKMLTADWTALDRLQQRIEIGIAAGELIAEPFGLQGYCAQPHLLRQAAEAYAASRHPDRSARLPRVDVGFGPKIRVGYSAGEFRTQATSLLLTEVLEGHDRDRFEIYAFDNGRSDGSELRRRIEAAVTEVVPIRTLNDMAAAVAIRERGIDILVNLNGYFGLARNNLFSLRPAPIQVNYLGFPGTLGAGFMDYLIGDAFVTPTADAAHYTEHLVQLPHSYQPNDAKRHISAAPVTRRDAGLPDDAVVFCCINNVYKITPTMFDVWMRLLQRVPHSVLWLFGKVPEVRENLRYEATQRGVAAERLVFAPELPPDEHLARLRLADLFLDSFPYNAHTSGSDALWAGLPVLTCTGATFPSRVGASLLNAVGLPELVTGNLADYEDLAHALATDAQRLAALRATLQAQRPTAPLFDSARYTQHLEAAYAAMVQRARRGLAPAPIVIAAQD